jgi:hypothetical protein
MAKLVIGTNKQTVVPAVVMDKSPAYYVEYTNNNGVLSSGTTLINTFDGINQIDVPYFGARIFSGKTLQNQNFVLGFNGGIKADNVFDYTFANSNIKKADLSGITYIEGNQCFTGCFGNCQQLGEVDISGLERIGKPDVFCGSQAFQSAFISNSTLTEFSFTNLKYLYGSLSQVFSSLTYASFTTIRFPVLEKCYSGGTSIQDFSVFTMFCANNVRHIYFNAFKSDTFGGKVKCLSQLFSSSVNGCTLHFPSNLDPQSGSTVISSLTGYPNFGGTNTVLAFDLPATE